MIIATADVRHDAPAHPTPGRTWPFALVTEQSTWFADSLTELVGVLVPGYAQMGDEEALGARWAYAAAVADVAQADLAARAGLEDLSEDELQVVLAPRSATVHLGSWLSSRVPLLLVRTDYAPFTDVPVPAGTVRFIDPSGERELLETLASLGTVVLLARPDDV